MPYKDKKTQKQYQRDYQRHLRAGGRYSATSDSQSENKTHKTLFSSCYRISKAQDLLHVLEDAINTVHADELSTPLQKARALGYLVGVGIRVIETATLENRVEALERVLKTRASSVSTDRSR